MIDPHQRRCETCENKIPIQTPLWASDTKLNLGHKCKITGKKCKKKFTALVGCASHSNKDGGEDILDELRQKIHSSRICNKCVYFGKGCKGADIPTVLCIVDPEIESIRARLEERP